MKFKMNATTAGIIAMVVLFLGNEYFFDLLMEKEVSLELKAWFVFLIITLYYVIVKSWLKENSNENKK